MKNVIIVKVGDPGNAAIPSDAEKETIRATIEKGFRDAGRDDIIVAVPYYLTIETNYAPPAVSIDYFPAGFPLRLETTIGDPLPSPGIDLSPQIVYG